VLVNPHHVRALTLPAALAPVTTFDLPEESLGPDLRLSPLQNGGFLLEPAGIAWLALALGGLASFVFNVRHLHWPRLLLFLALLLLALWRTAAIPFFAVVTGPVLALNFQEVLDRVAAPAGA